MTHTSPARDHGKYSRHVPHVRPPPPNPNSHQRVFPHFQSNSSTSSLWLSTLSGSRSILIIDASLNERLTVQQESQKAICNCHCFLEQKKKGRMLLALQVAIVSNICYHLRGTSKVGPLPRTSEALKLCIVSLLWIAMETLCVLPLPSPTPLSTHSS
eukprot:713783-Pleurochrysis_carterae.AAC.2